MSIITLLPAGSCRDVQLYADLGKGLRFTEYQVCVLATYDFERQITDSDADYLSSRRTSKVS